MIKLGIIGCGYWGPNLIRNFSQLKEAEVVWVCDLDESRLAYIKGLYPSLKTTEDYQEILKDREIEAICIATPVKTHYQIVKDALLAGKNVLVEKPFTLTSGEAQELIDISEEENLVLMVGHTFEYNEAVIKLKELMEKGELGRILYLYGERLNLGIFRDDVNVLWDLGAHDISILNYILKQEPIGISSQGMAHYQEGIEDTVFSLFSYPGEVKACLHLSWLDPLKVRKLTIVGDKKMAIFDDMDKAEPLKIYDRYAIKQPLAETSRSFKLIVHQGEVFAPKIKSTEPLQNECRHFLKCTRNGSRPRSDGHSGLAVIKILEAAQQSLKNKGKWVEIH